MMNRKLMKMMLVCDPPPLVKASEPAGNVKASEPAGNVKVNLELVNPNVLPRSVFHNQGRSQGGCSWCLSTPFAAQDCARRVPVDLTEQPSFAFTLQHQSSLAKQSTKLRECEARCTQSSLYVVSISPHPECTECMRHQNAREVVWHSLPI